MNDFKSFNAYEEPSSPQSFVEPTHNFAQKPPQKRSSNAGLLVLVLIFGIVGGFLGGLAQSFIAPIVQPTVPTASSQVESSPLKNENASSVGQNISNSGHGVVADVAASAMPAVVGISTDHTVTQEFMFDTREYDVKVTGSGVIVSPDGYIITNSHVVGSGNKPIQVLLEGGRSLDAKVLWQDPRQDIAVLKVESNSPLPFVKMGDSDKLVIGETAIAIGNPLGLDFQRSVTAGYISGLNRSITVERNSMGGLIQTDASINRGNSGGPLLNRNGEVIGINTIKVGAAEGLGFSIPINAVKTVVNQVIETGSYEPTLIGITGVDVTMYKSQLKIDIPVENGIVVLETYPDSAAANANLQPNDIITAVDDTPVKNMPEMRNKLNTYKVGDSATLTILRNGQEEKVQITFTPVQQRQQQ
ncbi:MAG: PDZ domain-containing protein [Tissierellia bacterium]|nr:PDZ domain-containing protein [Tissierellia bacterium]